MNHCRFPGERSDCSYPLCHCEVVKLSEAPAASAATFARLKTTTVAELRAQLATLPDGFPVRVLDNHTGELLDIRIVGTASTLDVDTGTDPDRVVVVMVEQ